MKMSLGAVLFFAASLGQALAADAEAAIRTGFVPSYIEALRSHDTGRIRSFLHPQVMACMNATTHQYFDYLAQQEAQDDVEGKYEITRVAPLSGPAPLLGLPEDGFHYPMQPAYEVHVEFKDGRLELVRFLSEAQGQWFEVYPCPNEKGVALVHDYIARGEEQRQRVAKLVAELKDPLLGELKDLVRQERIVDAVKRYQAVTGLGDLATARMVVAVIQAQ
jgi:hypothetical protein